MNQHHYYDSFAKEIIGKFQRISALVSHNPTSGNYHEEILRVVLRNFVSKRFSVKTGFVFKDEDHVSNQLDIMVIDEYKVSAYIYQDGDFAIVRPDAVVAIIEVKTTLTSSEFDKSLRNIASAKKLVDYPDRISGMVFGYKGTRPTHRVLDAWFKHDAASDLKDSFNLSPTIISFFTHSKMLIRFNRDNQKINDSNRFHLLSHISEFTKIDEEVSEGWQIRYILALIYAACEDRDFQTTRMFQNKSDANDLLNFVPAVPSVNAYELGSGYFEYVKESE